MESGLCKRRAVLQLRLGRYCHAPVIPHSDVLRKNDRSQGVSAMPDITHRSKEQAIIVTQELTKHRVIDLTGNNFLDNLSGKATESAEPYITNCSDPQRSPHGPLL